MLQLCLNALCLCRASLHKCKSRVGSPMLVHVTTAELAQQGAPEHWTPPGLQGGLATELLKFPATAAHLQLLVCQ